MADVCARITGMPGVYVPIKETLRGFKMILDGECDHMPEAAFMYRSDIDSVFAMAKEMEEA